MLVKMLPFWGGIFRVCLEPLEQKNKRSARFPPNLSGKVRGNSTHCCYFDGYRQFENVFNSSSKYISPLTTRRTNFIMLWYVGKVCFRLLFFALCTLHKTVTSVAKQQGERKKKMSLEHASVSWKSSDGKVDMYVLCSRQFFGGNYLHIVRKLGYKTQGAKYRVGRATKANISILVPKLFVGFAEIAWSELPSMTFIPEDDPRWRHFGVPGNQHPLQKKIAPPFYYYIFYFQGARFLSVMGGISSTLSSLTW